MTKQVFSGDQGIITAIQGSENERKQALQYFFNNPGLLKWVLRHVQLSGGSGQDGKDVFEESFIIFERQVRLGHFRGESALETFFHGIARRQWLMLRRKNKPADDITDHHHLPAEGQSPENILISEERRVILSSFIAQIGERCQKLIGLFQLNHSMREIRDIIGYSSDQVAANEVHSCRQKLKIIIHQNPELLETLKHRS